MRVLPVTLLGLVCFFFVAQASAFSISSGFSNGCHEQITLRAYADFLLQLPLDDVVVPDDEIWREVSAFLGDTFSDELEGALDDNVNDIDRFLLTSLIIGVRSPDTEGHSILNLSKLRELHSDPSPEGQYAHALRGPDDDDVAGNAVAIEGTRTRIRSLIAKAIELRKKPASEQVISGRFYLDFYGIFDVPVNGPMFYLGQAVHAMQDSFSHAIRAEDEGFRRIVHVMNYVDAIGSEHVEGRDGLAHSDSMDDCTGEPGDAGGTVDAAVRATVDVFIAARAVFTGQDVGATEAMLDKWLTLKPDCELDDGFCGNTRWVEVARIKQTKPYFEAIFGCSAAPRATGWGAPAALLLVLMMGLALRGRWSASWRPPRRRAP